MNTLSLDQAAELLKISPRSLADRRCRARLGLAARKIGPRKIVFIEAEVIRLIERGKEHLPNLGASA